MATDGAFRELLKDVLVQKEELETHLQAALDAAKTKDNLNKLFSTVKKFGKVLEELKVTIEEKTVTLGGIPSTKPASQSPPTLPAGPMPAPAPHAPSAQQQMPVAPPLKDNLKSHPPTPAANGNGEGIAPESRPPPAMAKSKVFHNRPPAPYPDFHHMRRNMNIPDSQRIYLPFLNPESTDETVYDYFSNLGYTVVDVKVFYGKVTSANVGFSTAAAVQQLLPQRFFLDDYNVTARPFMPKREDQHNTRNGNGYANYKVHLKQGRFQVFCGGIPTRATLEDVIVVLNDFGQIRDIRMPSMQGTYGSVIHRNIAFVDFERAEDAQNLCQEQIIEILGKEVECKPNTKPVSEILGWPAFRGSSLGVEPVASKGPAASKGSNVHKKAELGGGDAPEGMCIICKIRPQNCVMLWCGDTVTCMQCGEGLTHCPNRGCGKFITKRAEVAQD